VTALAGIAGKTVIVTGGASGIGRAVVERLLAEHANVVLVDADADAVGAATGELHGDRLLAIVADVAASEDTDRYMAAALMRFGRIDGLHANAGIAAAGVSIAATDPSEFDRTMAVNVRGVFLSIRAVLRALAEQGTPGAIVTTSSVLGLQGLAGQGAYCASKAAVISLTRTAAIEAGPAGHRVNAVLPGPIATPMATRIERSLPSEEREAFRRDLLAPVPLGRMGEAHEVAALVAWLLSDESAYVTGGIFSVDGGQAAG
jgi:NAD(P)-dependent dehydrogenase (short-subunit alcohol dehydrogenase family)